MIRKITLENFKSHVNTEIEFSEGSNVIVGDMGSGKSSIIEGIIYALFGTTQSINSRKIAVKDLIMAKPNPADYARLTLEFENLSDKYLIERILYRDKSAQAKIYKNSILIRGPKPSDVNDEIERVLGVNIDIFTRANYSEQNQLDFFINIPARDRKVMFDSMFDIDFYDSLYTKSRQVESKISAIAESRTDSVKSLEHVLGKYNISYLKEQVSKIKSTIDGDTSLMQNTAIKLDNKKSEYDFLKKNESTYNTLKNKLDLINAELELLSKENQDKVPQTNDINVLEDMQKNYEFELENLKQKLLDYQSSKNKIESTNDKIRIMSIQMQNNQKQVEELVLRNKNYGNVDIESLNNLLKTEVQNLNELSAKYDAYTRDSNAINLLISNINFELPKYNLIKDDIELNIREDIANKLNSLEKDYNEKTKILFGISKEIDIIKNSIKELSDLDSHCPICDSIIDDSKKAHINHTREDKIKLLEIKLIGMKKELEEIEIIKSKYNLSYNNYLRNIDFYNSFKERLSSLELLKTNLLDVNTKILDLRNLISKSNQIISDLQIKITNNDTRVQNELIIKRLSNQNAELKSNIDSLERDITTLNSFVDKNSDIAVRIDDVNKKLLIVYDDLRLLNNIIKSKELLVNSDSIKSEINTLNFNNNTISDLRISISTLEQEITHLKATIMQNNKLLEEYTKEIRNYDDIISNVLSIKEDILRINNIKSDVGIFAQVAKKTQEDVRSYMLDSINTIFADLWPQIYPYSDFENISLKIVDGDYKIIAKFSNGYTRELDDFVSGGERSSIALTLRIAIALAQKNNLGVLILDEPTHNLDRNAVASLSSIFNNYLLRFIGQIFIVTHDTNLQSLSQNVYHVSRDKLDDGPSRVKFLGS